MKKTLHTNTVTRAKHRTQQFIPKTVRRKTASGVSYTLSYTVPQKRKGYRPNEANQFGISDSLIWIAGA
jgi:hypothetical protein